jgi:crotonobetainyl-CoA:carnitine CoA-transferase CaiB-like acyl-CoA transferase
MPDDHPSARDQNLPLAGIRVVELANFIAAPTMGMFLGDYGAEVIKVERPDGGDEIRLWGNNVDGVGVFIKMLARNKKVVTADLRTPLGVEIVKRLIRDADVVTENYRTGTLEKWGLGWDVLHAINPRLIMVRVTGFGQTGPYRARAGFGTLAEGFSGFAYTNGFPDRPPLLPGFGLADATTGLAGAFLTMVALNERLRRGGEGQYIDLAIYEPLFTLIGPHVVDYDQLGIVQERNGSRLPFTAPRNTYQTRDGRWLAIAGSTQSTFVRMCEALGCADLIDDPRFSDNRERIKHAQALDERLQAAIAALDYDVVMQRFAEIGAAAAPVYNVAQIFEDPHVRARDNIVAVDDAELGRSVRMQNVLGKLSRTPGRVDWSGPKLGTHNREILVERFGFDEQQLRAAGLPL